MRKRPICLLCLFFMCGIWLMQLWNGPEIGGVPEASAIKKYLDDTDTATVYGELYQRSIKESSNSIYLKNTYLMIQSNRYSIQNIRIFTEEPCRLPIGSYVSVSGAINEIEGMRNPGEFDSRIYYHVQHIYYLMSADTISTTGKSYTMSGLRLRRY